MGREKKLEIGAINITMQPHSSEKYVAMFKKAYRLAGAVKIRGNTFGALSRMNPLDSNQDSKSGPLVGDIFRYTDIDKEGNWYNEKTRMFATEEDLKEIDVKDHLKPNSSRFSYIFYPKEHVLFYEAYYDGLSLGAMSAERFFRDILNQKEVQDMYGKISVNHLPDIDKFEEAIGLYKIENIRLEFARPNPDGLETATAKVMARMNKINADEITETAKSIKGEGLELDEELEIKAKVAAGNGMLEVRGKDSEGRPKSYSTKEHSWKVTEYYDEAVEIPIAILRQVGDRMKSILSKFLNND